MKLNATAEMLPITWTEFSDIHPYAPEAQTAYYRELLADMENSLKAITGFDAISFQPNSGAQGEYSGMLAIRRYQEAQGEAHRNICLIPKSAHDQPRHRRHARFESRRRRYRRTRQRQY